MGQFCSIPVQDLVSYAKTWTFRVLGASKELLHGTTEAKHPCRAQTRPAGYEQDMGNVNCWQQLQQDTSAPLCKGDTGRGGGRAVTAQRVCAAWGDTTPALASC